MGQYSKIIEKREYNDRAAAEMSEKYLLGENPGRISSGGHYTGDIMAALEYILLRYNIKADCPEGCINLQEILDCTLEPAGILYEQTDPAKNEGGNSDCMLAFTEEGAAVVITPSMLSRKYYIPSEGRHGIYKPSMKLKDEAYIINRPIPAENFSLHSFAKYVLSLITLRDWALIGAATLLLSLFGIIVPEINRLVLGEYVNMPLDKAMPLIVFACLGLAIVYIIRTLLQCIKELLTAHISLNTEQKVEAAFIARILLLPMDYFRETTSGRISANVIFSKKLAALVISAIVGTSLTTFFSIAYVGEIANISVGLMGIAVFILLIKLTLTVITNIFALSNEKLLIDSESSIRDFNYMIFKGIEKIKTAGAENRVYSNWAWLFRSNLRYTYDPPMIVKMKPVIDIFISAGSTIIFLIVFANSGLPASDYIAFISVFGMLSATFDQIGMLSEKGTVAGTYVSRLKPILDASCSVDDTGKSYVRNVIGSVHFENVCMNYKGNDDFKIENLSMTIRPGEKVAIVGLSGCGKSSLVNLLTGINRASSGDIFVDGKSINHMNQRSLCRQN